MAKNFTRQVSRLVSESDNYKDYPIEIQKRENRKLIGRYKQLVALFAVLDVFVAVLIGITAHYYVKEGKGSVSSAQDVKICLPYDDVRLHPDEEHLCVDEPGENKTECCLKPEATLDNFISHFAAHWFKKRLNDENPKFTSCNTDDRKLPNIKVVGKIEKQRNNTQQIEWDFDSSLSYSEGMISYDGGRIIIHESGLYNIYSQVVFQHDTPVADNDQALPLIFTHTVFLKPFGSTESYEKVVLRSSNSECQCHVARHNTTSYVGTSYHLSKGDRLYVSVRNVDDILPSAHMNFFGVHML